MATQGTADRLAAVREALAATESPAERLPDLAELITCAAELSEGEDDGAPSARPVLDEALTYLREASAQLPPDGEEHLFALFLEAEACLLRDGDPGSTDDLDRAIDCLRRVRSALSEDDPDRAEVETKLGAAVLRRAARPGGNLADLDDAGALLASVLDPMACGDPGRRPITGLLAIQRAVRFAAFAGSEDDRMTALAFADEGLAGPTDDEQADGSADLSHFVIAWMALSRQLTTAQRSGLPLRPELEAAWRDGPAVAALLAEFGALTISPEDAENALAHLRQMSAAPDGDELRSLLPVLWIMALFAVISGRDSVQAIDQLADDLRHVTAELEHAVSVAPEGTQDHADFLSMRATMLALLSEASGGAGGRVSAATASKDAAARFPTGHPIRFAHVDLATTALRRQVTDAEQADDAAIQLDQVLTALIGMPNDDPQSAHAMAVMNTYLFGAAAAHRSVIQDDRIMSQLEQALAGLSADDPARPFVECTYWSSRCLHAVLRQQPDEFDAAIEKLKRCAGSIPPGHPTRTYALFGVAFALVDRHAMGGEMRHLKEAETYVRLAFESIDPAGPFAEGTNGHGGLLYLRGTLAAAWCVYDPSLSRMSTAVSDLERAQGMIGDEEPLRSAVAAALEMARAALPFLAGSPDRGVFLAPASRDAFDQLLKSAQSMRRDHPHYPAVVGSAVSGLALKGLADKNPKLIDQAIAMIADACTVPGLAPRERPRLLMMHGYALQTRYFQRRSPRDLSNAIDRLEEARRAVEQEIGSPYAATVLKTLSGAYRLRGDAARGDVDRAVTVGLAGLREHAGDVLLQDSDDNALYIARHGTGDATEMARWFLDRGREAAAVGALELGRGMVLHAATSGTRVEEALRASGHAALAVEWARGLARDGTDSGTATPDLRYRVMLAIEQSPAEARLLAPPSVGDIAAALKESDADALVYLLPRDADGPGLAVLVAADKKVRRLPLPRLLADDQSPLRAFVLARRAADASGTEAAVKDWEGTLDKLCTWSWRVAVGPVLDALLAPLPGRHKRLVLVPYGELGLVPWHAARSPGGDYACQQAVFSYAASGRQFVDATGRRPRPWGQDPVLISDAEPSLRLTAAGIRQLFAGLYPTAAVFGYARDKLPPTVRGSTAATAADVLSALPGADTPGASLLHFGCHGRTEVPVLHSRLDLGAGRSLRVQDILRQARAGQSRADRGVGSCGLVILAACLSDVAEADYDEALTLAAAFSSAGAVGVVAARWSVEERVTALFMAMFHRYLNVDQLSPARALRAAQLWMLNPRREIPDGLPAELRDEAELVGEPGGPELMSPAAWAGFGYQGR
jgi:hypothetical protein